ncbi:type ISP restriction/modification enzyme, partial [Streptomyces beijiangensis]
GAYQAAGNKDRIGRESALFRVYSSGLKSGRDAWVYNFSQVEVRKNMQSMIDCYNRQVDGFRERCVAQSIAVPTFTDVDSWIDTSPEKISWDRADKGRVARGERYRYDEEWIVPCTYRPFTKEWAY